MQSVGTFRARRNSLFFLACVVNGLTGCGGGGGAGPASAPPSVSAPPIDGIESGAAAELISELGGAGHAWIGLVNADNGAFTLSGQDPETNRVLAKLPEPAIKSEMIIATTYSRFAHFKSILDPVHDPGRYMLWGRLHEEPVSGQLRYDMTGLWTCTGCTEDGRIIQESADGRLDLDAQQAEAVFAFSGSDFELAATLDLHKSGTLNATDGARLSYGGQVLDVETSRISGGIFGPAGEEAGLLFGITTSDQSFAGAALGVRSD